MVRVRFILQSYLPNRELFFTGEDYQTCREKLERYMMEKYKIKLEPYRDIRSWQKYPMEEKKSAELTEVLENIFDEVLADEKV